MARNPEFHKRTKHIDICYHFVREKAEDGQVVLEYISMKNMLADIMTKPIKAMQFEVLRNKLKFKRQRLPSRVGVLLRRRLDQLWNTGRYRYDLDSVVSQSFRDYGTIFTSHVSTRWDLCGTR